MDRLLDAALVGTAQRGDQPLPTALPVAELVDRLPALSPSRHLLLVAGAQALYARAGRELGDAAPAVERAPTDRLPACSQAAARTIDQLLRDDKAGILPEALERLRGAGLRLPHHLLVPALAAGRAASHLRDPLLPTLDARGAWLALKNPDWFWAAGGALIADTLPDNAETIWQEGLPSERLAIIQTQRGTDPTVARAWLDAVWKSEKADFRAHALASLTVGLSLADEPFLEAALDDRSQGVRYEAVRLLTSLPDSALSRRMRDRADRLLAYTPHQRSLFRSITQALGGTRGILTISPPEAIGPDWQRDGITSKPQTGTGRRAWWLRQVIAAVPPMHWTSRFAAPPAELIAAAVADKEWGQVVIDGWTSATRAFADPEWAAALWSHWGAIAASHGGAHDARKALLRAMPPEAAFALVEPLLDDARREEQPPWMGFVTILPTPWSTSLGRRYLDVTRERMSRAPSGRSENWLITLATAARALPASLFDEALVEWRISASDDWLASQRQRRIEEFTATIALRRRLMEEIPL